MGAYDDREPARGRFYFGGNIYDGWSTVPDQYKIPDFSRPAWQQPGGGMLFTFTW